MLAPQLQDSHSGFERSLTLRSGRTLNMFMYTPDEKLRHLKTLIRNQNGGKIFENLHFFLQHYEPRWTPTALQLCHDHIDGYLWWLADELNNRDFRPSPDVLISLKKQQLLDQRTITRLASSMKAKADHLWTRPSDSSFTEDWRSAYASNIIVLR